jgi:hypothetical protein
MDQNLIRPSEFIGALINFILGFAGLFAFGWTAIGIPLAIVIWLIKRKKPDFNKRRLLYLFFGGPVLLLVIFSIYALLFMVQAIFGINLNLVSTPQV